MEWKGFQQQINDYDKKYGWHEDKSVHIVLHLLEELGEISRLMLRAEKYKKEEFSCDELGQEITDLFYLALKLANKFDINLDDQWRVMWGRYEKKVNRK